MGWCHEFGSQVREGCGHPMTAGETACSCTVCEVTCTGKFGGCAAVWARGPRQITLSRPPELTDAHVPPAAPAPAAITTTPSVGAEAPEDGRGEVLEWLQAAFDGVRSDLSLVIDAVGRQQEALNTLTQAETATTHLVELAEALPDRICAAVEGVVATAVAAAPAAPVVWSDHQCVADAASDARDIGSELREVLPGYIDEAVRSIVRPSQGAMMNRVDEVAAELRDSLVEVQASAAELRNEMARLAAFRSALVADQPALARTVENATARADGRLTELAQKMESLSERPEWQAVRSRIPFRRDGPPSL